ncbi:MAG: hypothetical protein K2K88_02505, partial [Muribaculaceae bacterium]|nr:hypothetical protein [Muribaculaceae bacterium]
MAVIIGMVALQSCDKGPDYEKMRPSMMDIVGAKSVGFIEESVASRGEALSSGLYKIDANGNISAVAVYFTEDEYGNQTQHKDEVKMIDADIHNAGTDYLYFIYCEFVDKKGERIYGLPYRILVRKSDGKMWSLDNTEVYYRGPDDGQFYQADDGTLYYGDFYGTQTYTKEIYKLNLKTEPATEEQVTANIEIQAPIAVDSKGVICGPVNRLQSYWWRGTFAWQNSGFQEVKWDEEDYPITMDYSDIVEGLKYSYTPYDDHVCVVDFRGQIYSVCGLKPRLELNGKGTSLSYYPFVELGICNKISIGDTPGSAKIDDSETINIKNDIGSNYGYEIESVMTTDEYI